MAESSTTRSRKRARVLPEPGEAQDPEAAAVVPPKRDTEVWFDDGNIVVVADETAFKVHRGVLSLHSEVFRDMFLIPPPEDDEALEGCPIVHVSDSASDIRQLLSVLYKGRTCVRSFVVVTLIIYRCFPRCLLGSATVKFQLAEVLVRMAHKYNIPDLKRDALARIQELYTDNYYDFYVPEASGGPLSYQWEDAFQVVRLAHLTGVKSMLPVALYLCCMSPLFFSTRDMVELAARCREQGEVSLPEEDMFRCIRAQPHLVRASIQLLASTFEGGLSGLCTGSQRCKSSYKRLLHTLLSMHSDSVPGDVDCLSIQLRDLLEDYCPDAYFCDACKRRFDHNHRECRKAIWKELPCYLELEIDGWARELGEG